MDAHAPPCEPPLQLGYGGARVVQREQFVRVAVEAGGSAAAATPRPRIGLQVRDLGGGVEGRCVMRAGQAVCHPSDRGSGFPAGVGMEGRRMDGS